MTNAVALIPPTYQFRQFTAADGLRLAADVGGDPFGPAVVMLHGRGQTRNSWSEGMRSLMAQGYYVINYDARGHGESEWSPVADYSLEARLADLEVVLSTIGKPAALVGASMGGFTSFYAAAGSMKAQVAALVLVDIVPRPSPEGVKKIRGFLGAHKNGFASLEEAANAVSQYNPHRPRPADISGLAKNLRKGDDGRLYWHWDPRWPEGPGRSEETIQTMLELCGKISAPTLLVRGLRSELVHDASVQEFRDHFPGLEVYEVAGAGHMVAGDSNDAFNQGVIGFLRRNLPTTA